MATTTSDNTVSTETAKALRNFRNSADIENFYRFVYENELRREARMVFEAIWNTMNMFNNMYKSDEMVKGLEPMAIPPVGPGVFDPRQILGGTVSIVNRNLPPLLNAPCVILILGDQRAIAGPQINIGICGQNMNLVANSLGIKACWVGFSAVIENLPALKEKLGIKPPWHVITSMVLGHPRFSQEGIVPREYRPVAWFKEGSEEPEIET